MLGARLRLWSEYRGGYVSGMCQAAAVNWDPTLVDAVSWIVIIHFLYQNTKLNAFSVSFHLGYGAMG